MCSSDLFFASPIVKQVDVSRLCDRLQVVFPTMKQMPLLRRLANCERSMDRHLLNFLLPCFRSMQDWIPSSSKSMPSLRDFVQSDINEFVSKSKLETSIAKSHLGDLAFLCLFAGRDFHWLPVEADSFEPLLRIGSLLIQNSKGLSMWHPLIATITVETCGIQLRQGIFNTLLEMLSRLSNLMRPSELNSLILHLLCHRDERQQFSKLVSWYLNEEDCSLPDLYEEKIGRAHV